MMSEITSPVFLFLVKSPEISTQAIAVSERYHFSVQRSTSIAYTGTMFSTPPCAVSMTVSPLVKAEGGEMSKPFTVLS